MRKTISLGRAWTTALVCSALAATAVAASDRDPPSTGPSASRHRQPVALALSRDGSRLFVANQRSGSFSVVDLATSRVASEFDIGRSLADLAPLPDGRHLLAVDREANALLVLADRDRTIQVVGRIAVSPDPVSVLVSADGASCVVASLWSCRLTRVALTSARGEDPPTLRVVGTIDLPFSPRNLAEVRKGARLIVADAFGGKLAVVDLTRGEVETVRSLPAHNIRGLAESPDGKTLVVAHQVLNRLARTTFEDIHWGSLIGNHLRFVRVDALLTQGPEGDLLRGSRLMNLGEAGDAAGDPAALAFSREGEFVVALAGVGEVATGRGPGEPVWRIAVGRRPTALALARDGSRAYVADTFDDTISVVDLGVSTRRGAISLGARPDLGQIDRGARLFHDAKLAHDGWMSCHSCHTDGHSNGLLSDTLGDGSFGAPKRVPSLLGVGATPPWNWGGSLERLDAQVRKSIETTMHGTSPTTEQVEDLTAYLRSLAPPTLARTDAIPQDDAAVVRGKAVFLARECATCHTAPDYTSPERYDVGLVDEVGNHEFNPPSLRGVSRRQPLLHDGRAATLDDVFRTHHHPRDTILSPEEIGDLVAYLKSL